LISPAIAHGTPRWRSIPHLHQTVLSTNDSRALGPKSGPPLCSGTAAGVSSAYQLDRLRVGESERPRRPQPPVCPSQKNIWQMSRSTEARRLCRKRAMVVRSARKQGQVMSGRRRAKALIHLMYFVFRAWLALTTPCVAQTHDGLGSERLEFASRADGGNSGDYLHVVTAKILAPLSICLLAARLQHGVARSGILR
jgi:hypothetical protein